MPKDSYVDFREYLEKTKGAVLLFVLRDFRGQEVNRQMVHYDELEMNNQREYTAKFVVDELLTAKMIPGSYTLDIYLSQPNSDVDEPTIDDYCLTKRLTEAGIKIQVRGGTKAPTRATSMEGG